MLYSPREYFLLEDNLFRDVSILAGFPDGVGRK